MTEKMPILELLDLGEVELLVRKLPREIVEEHLQDDTETIGKMFALLPIKKFEFPWKSWKIHLHKGKLV